MSFFLGIQGVGIILFPLCATIALAIDAVRFKKTKSTNYTQETCFVKNCLSFFYLIHFFPYKFDRFAVCQLSIP